MKPEFCFKSTEFHGQRFVRLDPKRSFQLASSNTTEIREAKVRWNNAAELAGHMVVTHGCGGGRCLRGDTSTDGDGGRLLFGLSCDGGTTLRPRGSSAETLLGHFCLRRGVMPLSPDTGPLWQAAAPQPKCSEDPVVHTPSLSLTRVFSRTRLAWHVSVCVAEDYFTPWRCNIANLALRRRTNGQSSVTCWVSWRCSNREKSILISSVMVRRAARRWGNTHRGPVGKLTLNMKLLHSASSLVLLCVFGEEASADNSETFWMINTEGILSRVRWLQQSKKLHIVCFNYWDLIENICDFLRLEY